MSAWNDESQTVTNDRHEAARNPHRATTRSLLAEAYDHGYDGPPDPWFTPAELAALETRIAKRLAAIDALPTNPPF